VVVEQNNYKYDEASNVIGVTNFRRFHDAPGNFSPLDTTVINIPSRVTYVTNYFDRANRITATVDVGTNGGVPYERPATVPGRSDNVLVTSYGYDAGGNVMDVTDPRGITNRTARDYMGNVVATFLNFTGGSPGAQTDVTTYFIYDSFGRLEKRVAAQPAGTPHQSTTYQYGVSPMTDSDITSNEIVWKTLHPDPDTGLSTAAEADTYTVNALGERTSFTDRAGTTHAYSYDVLGRLTADRVTAFGAGVDTAVQRLEYRYDAHGRMTLASSFSADTGGVLLDQVARGYSGFGQLINEWQAHTGGAVAGVTPRVNYVYTNAGVIAGNNSRLARINYPSDYALDFVYEAGTFDAAMSRPTRLAGPRADTGAVITLEAFKYLGASTVIERARPEINTTLSMVSPTGAAGPVGDKYTGLDRFDRVVLQRWANGPGGNGAIVAQNAYSYDRNGNRLTDSIYGANYTYDALNQVQSFTRAAWAPGVKNQQFSFDALGNWNTLTTDGSAQSRITNTQNEVTNVGGTTLVYSPVGNMLVDTDWHLLRYDAWNRLVTVNDQYGTLLARYQYDALNRRITEQVATPAIPDAGFAPVRDLFYSDQWQVLEERIRTTPGVVAATADTRYVWSPVYVDALIARDRNADGNAATGTGGLEERVYALQDANWNTHAIVAASGVPGYSTGQVINRFIYTPFGEHQVLDNAYWAAPAAIPWDRLFQGHEFTDATKLTHMRNRDYSGALGRFVQWDPIGFAAGDNNFYRFVGNGPTVATDPTGLDKQITDAGVHLGIEFDLWDEDGNHIGVMLVDYGDYGWRRGHNSSSVSSTNSSGFACSVSNSHRSYSSYGGLGRSGEFLINIVKGETVAERAKNKNKKNFRQTFVEADRRLLDYVARSVGMTSEELLDSIENGKQTRYGGEGRWFQYSVAFNNCRTFAHWAFYGRW
jgi:RHS repeat-associated protein